MKVLYILKSEPDATVQALSRAIDRDCEVTVAPIFQNQTDWDALVELIFANDKVICWW